MREKFEGDIPPQKDEEELRDGDRGKVFGATEREKTDDSRKEPNEPMGTPPEKQRLGLVEGPAREGLIRHLGVLMPMFNGASQRFRDLATAKKIEASADVLFRLMQFDSNKRFAKQALDYMELLFELRLTQPETYELGTFVKTSDGHTGHIFMIVDEGRSAVIKTGKGSYSTQLWRDIEKAEGDVLPQEDEKKEENDTGFDSKMPIRAKNKEGKWESLDALNPREVSSKEFIRWAEESRDLKGVPWEKIDLNNPRKRLLVIQLFLSK